MGSRAEQEERDRIWEGHKARSMLSLNENERELARRITELREQVAALVSDVDMHMHVTTGADGTAKGHAMLDGERWVGLARNDLQTGFMKLERAVTRQRDW